MTRRKIGEEDVRKLTRLGGSLGLTLPKEIIKHLKLREKQKMVVTRRGNTITIKDWEE